FIYSRRPHRDKQTSVLVLYLFAASSPRQANRRFRALSIRGVPTATSKPAFSCIIYSRRIHRDKHTGVFVHYLFAVESPRQANEHFESVRFAAESTPQANSQYRALSIRAGRTPTATSNFLIFYAHGNLTVNYNLQFMST